MGIDWNRVYRVVLNGRYAGKRPGKTIINSLRRYRPKCRIHGFGYYGFQNCWYLLVEDPTFPPTWGNTINVLPWTAVTGEADTPPPPSSTPTRTS